ncbi:MYCBP-associated protein family-domain-containing protein [Polychytrium aggregatum]|uniref:MYCBP-associated protein family-domain-containing protein n=1 Tax=Polychytrium aggregatum TaxID=110093 RepID=UPI0022FE8579|nr:MYCBP-associated protein family-domain-containing protein [Polychytrium aggregatum]KAI9203527.1 MYCBP-associated protein family-domain-containing protein [Polychytrium aggregatum]
MASIDAKKPPLRKLNICDLKVPGKILVARPLPPDYLGEEPEFTDPNHRPIPITLITAQHYGPRREKDGNVVAHTLLGDTDDYLELERIYGSIDKPADQESQDDSAESVARDAEPQKSQKATTFATQQMSRRRSAALRAQQREEKKRWFKKLHIFQRYRELREEHALKNWRRHSIEWAKVEARLSNKSKKSPEDILMARLGEHRMRLEERDLIEEALRLLESRNVNFWKTGIRIGNDLLGLTLPMPKGGPREIERLRTYESCSQTYKAPVTEYRHSRKQELKHVISALDSFYVQGDSGYMEVIGKGFTDDGPQSLAEEFIKRLDESASKGEYLGAGKERSRRQSETKDRPHSVATRRQSKATTSIARESAAEKLEEPEEVTKNLEVVDEDTDVRTGSFEMKIVFGNNRLVFENYLGQVSTLVLTVYNQGATACHFKWVKEEAPNPLKVNAVYDGIQRFFFYHHTGVILPGTAFDFPIIFKSASPGIFRESWKFVTSPRCSDKLQHLELHGIAIEPDEHRDDRSHLELLLRKRQAMALAQEVIDKIFRNFKSFESRPSHAASIKRPDGTMNERIAFLKMNQRLHLSYDPQVYDALSQLASDTAALVRPSLPYRWDASITSLSELCGEIRDVDTRSSHLSRLNDLVSRASVCPKTTTSSLHYIVGFDIMVDLADRIVDISEALRTSFGLPMARSAAVFFPEATEAKEENEGADAGKGGVTTAADASRKVPPSAPGAGDDKKKAAAGPGAGKDAKKGAPPPAKKAPGKKTNEANADQDEQQRPQLAKLITSKKPRHNSGWTPERRQQELLYKQELKVQTRQLLVTAIDRMTALFQDGHEL